MDQWININSVVSSGDFPNRVTYIMNKPEALAMVTLYISGADPEISERGDAVCRLPWLDGKENVRFQVV